jgi:transposase
MATLQCKTTQGRKYWYIVESRRINGKPRPVVLAYLGKTEDIMKRLTSQTTKPYHIKSYSHGLVYALWDKAASLNIVEIINRYVEACRSYMPTKPIINGLTGGETILLAAFGRACRPTSKQGWADWANTTSLGYLLKPIVSKMDSQHFWDHMDCLSEESIEKIEADLIESIWKNYDIKSDTLLFDTTNFFTYIDSTNKRCTIAQRGKNKQKRTDLRQIGYALVVTREDHIPLFQHTYVGNQPDCITFQKVIEKIKTRLSLLNLDFTRHTLIFDKGMPTKKNFAMIDDLKCSYVTSIKLAGHKDLIESFKQNAKEISVNEEKILAFRTKKKVCNKERVTLVYLSESLREGVMRGLRESIAKRIKLLDEIRHKLGCSKRKINQEKKKKQIDRIISKDFKDVIEYQLLKNEQKLDLQYSVNEVKLEELKKKSGFKILVSDREEWSSTEIIQAYNGQAAVEEEFKNTKNPFHLAVCPQYHWTDQKIRVHFLICFISHLLSRLLYKDAKEKLGFSGQLNTLLEKLNHIRVASYIVGQTKGKMKKEDYRIEYTLEDASDEQKKLIDAFSISPQNNITGRLFSCGVYK